MFLTCKQVEVGGDRRMKLEDELIVRHEMSTIFTPDVNISQYIQYTQCSSMDWELTAIHNSCCIPEVFLLNK